MGTSGVILKGYMRGSVHVSLTCTMCWAQVLPEHQEQHTEWHEHVEQVPTCAPRYPAERHVTITTEE